MNKYDNTGSLMIAGVLCAMALFVCPAQSQGSCASEHLVISGKVTNAKGESQGNIKGRIFTYLWVIPFNERSYNYFTTDENGEFTVTMDYVLSNGRSHYNKITGIFYEEKCGMGLSRIYLKIDSPTKMPARILQINDTNCVKEKPNIRKCKIEVKMAMNGQLN